MPDDEDALNGKYGEMIASVLAEQDDRSPHLYFANYVKVKEGSVLLDVGAAEGLITLLNIDKIKKHIYLSAMKSGCRL